MRNPFVSLAIVAMSMLVLVACEESQQPAQASTAQTESSNPLIGAWEFVSSRVVLPDTVISAVNTSDRVGLYFFSEAHWGFVGSTPDGGELLYAGNGSYTLDGNVYTETVDYHTVTDVIGTRLSFEFEIDGDTLKKVGYLPVWEEIKSIAGDATEARIEETRVRANR